MPEIYDRKNDSLIELLITEIQNLRGEVTELRTDLKSHMMQEAVEIGEIKEAFSTAKHVVWFIKWASFIGSALFVAWVSLKEHFTIGIK